MADGIFNIAKGRFVHWATLPAAADAIILVPLLAAGLEADDTLNNYDDLAALLAAANDEATGGGWNRKTISSGVTVTVDDTNNRVDVDIADQTWTAVAAANNTGKLLMCYDGDTGAGTDANILPLSYHDFAVTTDGTDVVAQIAAAGIARAA